MKDIRSTPFSHFELPAESSTISLWQRTVEASPPLEGEGGYEPTRYPPLQEEIMADIGIVGGGITGATAALLLQKAGYSVVLIDAHPVGYGVSGFNSGHLTSMLLDMTYRQIVNDFGEEATRTIARGVVDAIDLIDRNVRDYRIDCDFERLSGYLYAEKPEQMDALREEYNVARNLGLRLERISGVPLPFHTEEAVIVPDQARIHPLKYVQALANAFVAQGGRIFENSRVLDVKAEPMGVNSIETEAGRIRANEVIIATHTPIGFRPGLQSRLEAIRSYIIGVRVSERIEDALFWDMEQPYHYLRQASDEHGPLLLIGGEDHKTGEKIATDQCFANLEQYARERFAVDSVDYHWSAQLYDSVDGLPYVGKLAGTYVATGYSGEGLTFGTLSAMIIADQIQGLRNDCGDVLSPSRAKPLASAGSFLSDNMSTLTHFVKDRLSKPEVEAPQDIAPGEGKICQIEGKKVAVYHSPEGVMHFMSPVCTHLGCIVGWNAAEKSWDCPCHGGRFDACGKVLNGPPVGDLKPLEDI